MISLLIGLIFFVFGLMGLVIWWDMFINFILGFLPFCMMIAGFLGIIAGITSIKDHASSKKDEKKLKAEK
ncbi:hypothetical protein ACFL5N_01530 [bacterium]